MAINGILNVHKPSGMTSRRAVDIVARVARTKHAGHAGTLDPLAEGVLVIGLGWATRLVSYIQERPKTYRALFLLGRRSDTDDVTGAVEEIAHAPVPTRAQIDAVLPRFLGEISQVPPAYSAVHVAGERAYHRARRGDEVLLTPRTVHVYRAELAAYEHPRLGLTIECGSGTYIRALGRDLGAALGCGAVMKSLVREAIGPFRLDDAVRPDELTSENIARHLVSPRVAVDHLQERVCSADELQEIACGRPISRRPAQPGSATDRVAMLTAQGELAAIGEAAENHDWLRPKLVFPVAGQASEPVRKI
ncbi:MAG: tRNA pseudouridine(55) synthase TruB [Planctomycetaceae bacterium]